MLSIFLSAAQTHREKEIESFCASYGTDFTWLDPYTAKFSITQAQAIQLRVLYEPLRDDLGIKMTMVIGWDEEPLMRLALACAVEEHSGKIMELGDLILLMSQKGDHRLLNVLDQIMGPITKEVLETAKMYLLTGGNSVQASTLLYVHRNTFTYRLHKFIDQTKIDVREAVIAYALHLYFALEQSLHQ